MKTQDIKSVLDALKEFNESEVLIYASYLKSIIEKKKRDGTLQNPWMQYAKSGQLVSIYKKVEKDGLFIDGTTITLQFKGALMVSYNFQAYKNKLLKIYPETLFDLQNVYEGDEFSFEKNSGNVNYTHKIKDPFSNNKKLIGAYCIIKNKRGHFIETINQDDIKKMRSVAKTQQIWEKWFGEMVLKSVIKRACKRHFNDIVTNIETLDNENYDLKKGSGIDLKKNDDEKEGARVLKHINNSKNEEQLNRVSGMVEKYDLIDEFDNKLLTLKNK